MSGILGKGGNPVRVESTNGSISLDANKILPKKNDNFEFKIDFDDLEGPSIDIENDSQKDADGESRDTNKESRKDAPNAPTNADSTKNKVSNS